MTKEKQIYKKSRCENKLFKPSFYYRLFLNKQILKQINLQLIDLFEHEVEITIWKTNNTKIVDYKINRVSRPDSYSSIKNLYERVLSAQKKAIEYWCKIEDYDENMSLEEIDLIEFSKDTEKDLLKELYRRGVLNFKEYDSEVKRLEDD